MTERANTDGGGRRPVFLTVMAILFAALAISNATKVFQGKGLNRPGFSGAVFL